MSIFEDNFERYQDWKDADGFDIFEQGSTSIVTYIVDGKEISEAEFAQQIREKYMETPPVGYSSEEISRMDDSDILHMDYFLNE